MGTIIVGLLVLMAVAAAAWYLIKNKKSGGCSGCSGCSSAGSQACHLSSAGNPPENSCCSSQPSQPKGQD